MFAQMFANALALDGQAGSLTLFALIFVWT